MGFGKLLILTYLCSFLLYVLLCLGYTLSVMGKIEDVRIFYMIVIGGLFINFQLLFISAPGIIISEMFSDSKQKAFIACFAIPLIILSIILSQLLELQRGDFQAYTIAIISFLLVLGCFFFNDFTPNNKKLTTKGTN